MAAGIFSLIDAAYLYIPPILTWVVGLSLAWRFRRRTCKENRGFQFSYLELLFAIVLASLAVYALPAYSKVWGFAILSCTFLGIVVGWLYTRFRASPGRIFARSLAPVLSMAGWVSVMFGTYAGGWALLRLLVWVVFRQDLIPEFAR